MTETASRGRGIAGSTEPSLFVPPRNRMLVAILSLLGLLVSIYMLAYALGLAGSLICTVGDCEAVQSSPFSRIGPFPVAAFGVLGYLALMGVSLFGLQPASQGSRLVPFGLLLGGIAGVGFTAYLTYLEAFVIRAWCQWCVSSGVIMVLAFLGTLPEVRRLGNQR